jgi:protein-tyrosine phosphatase
MWKNYSYLMMAAFFISFSILCYFSAEKIFGIVFMWAALVFVAVWGMYKAKVKSNKDYTKIMLRDTTFKYCWVTLLLWPFFIVRYLSLVVQSLAETPISKITNQIYMGQQPLWFHSRIFKSFNITAVLDTTIEGRAPLFLVYNKSISYFRIPILDKTSPSMSLLDEGVRWGIAQISKGRTLYVHCGGGHERSALFVSAILMRTGFNKNLEKTLDHMKEARPKVRLLETQRQVLVEWLGKGGG